MKRGVKKPLLVLFGLLLFSIPGSQTPVGATEQNKIDPKTAKSFSSAIATLKEYPRRKISSEAPPVYAKSYLLMDAETSKVLVGTNPNLELPIASITKMVTALVARELFKLDETVTISSNALQIPGSKIDLRSGEKITVQNLLKGLLIQSGNDAAFSLAYHYSGQPGEYQKFVAKMNEYVTANQLKLTRFGDPAGLDDAVGRSTAFELAHLARLFLADPVLAKIVITPEETITSTDGQITHQLKNSNRLILGDSPYFLPNVLGIKTGFTPDAGHCLVAAYKSNGRVLIGVVLNTAEYTISASASEMRKLFIWADQNIETVTY